ncbi:hypothetical protein TPB0596_22930 [Tsukamurella pulmonis]|nr:hypothetical protein TPB0596_22930 [Tsukamurella pulmonis]
MSSAPEDTPKAMADWTKNAVVGLAAGVDVVMVLAWRDGGTDGCVELLARARYFAV